MPCWRFRARRPARDRRGSLDRRLRSSPAGSFSAATVAASEYGWKAGVPAFLAAGFVGYTRMEKNKHYLSDVLFAAALAVVPYVAPGGGGVIVLF